jgi:hypothetical protein
MDGSRTRGVAQPDALQNRRRRDPDDRSVKEMRERLGLAAMIPTGRIATISPARRPSGSAFAWDRR